MCLYNYILWEHVDYVDRIIKIDPCILRLIFFFFIWQSNKIILMKFRSWLTAIIVIFSGSTLYSPPLSSSPFLSLFLSSRWLPPQHLVSRPLGTSSDGLQEPVKINIPRYVLRGQGKDEHFEFEVKVSWIRSSFILHELFAFWPVHPSCLIFHHPCLSGWFFLFPL